MGLKRVIGRHFFDCLTCWPNWTLYFSEENVWQHADPCVCPAGHRQPGEWRVQVHPGPVGLLSQLRHPRPDQRHLRRGGRLHLQWEVHQVGSRPAAAAGGCRTVTPRLPSLSNLRDLLPSRCNLGEAFCEGTCNAIGRKGGKCVEESSGVQDCQCDETFLTGSQFALCAAESTCRLDCQRRGSVLLPPLSRPTLTSLFTGWPLVSAMAGTVSATLMRIRLSLSNPADWRFIYNHEEWK